MTARPLTLSSAREQAPKPRQFEQLQVAGVVGGLVGGVLAGGAGALLTACSWFARSSEVRHWLATVGAVLLCLTIPLVLLGGCCLDWLEPKSSALRASSAFEDEEDEDA